VLLDRLTADAMWGLKALGQKGLCLKAIGRYEEALVVFRTALDLPSGRRRPGVASVSLCSDAGVHGEVDRSRRLLSHD